MKISNQCKFTLENFYSKFYLNLINKFNVINFIKNLKYNERFKIYID